MCDSKSKPCYVTKSFVAKRSVRRVHSFVVNSLCWDHWADASVTFVFLSRVRGWVTKMISFRREADLSPSVACWRVCLLSIESVSDSTELCSHDCSLADVTPVDRLLVCLCGRCFELVHLGSLSSGASVSGLVKCNKELVNPLTPTVAIWVQL